MAGYWRILCTGAMGSCFFNNVSFLNYFQTLMPSVNGFVTTLVSEPDCHVGIHFK